MDTNYAHYAHFMKAGRRPGLRFCDAVRGELCACEILEEFQITQPTLSYHMKILSESGLVNSRRDGVWMKYSINRDALERIKQIFNGIESAVEKSQVFVGR